MVMTLLGPSLEDIFTYCNRRFSLKTCLMVGIQMIERIRYVHSRMFLHRDIKPDNFLIHKTPSNKRLFVIDFGLAKRYMDSKTRTHIPYKDGK
jgi:serine/threonine protein kinase